MDDNVADRSLRLVVDNSSLEERISTNNRDLNRRIDLVTDIPKVTTKNKDSTFYNNQKLINA